MSALIADASATVAMRVAMSPILQISLVRFLLTATSACLPEQALAGIALDVGPDLLGGFHVAIAQAPSLLRLRVGDSGERRDLVAAAVDAVKPQSRSAPA